MDNMELENQKIKKVTISEFQILDTLGKGSYGRVRLCKNKKNGKVFAMKMLKKSEIIKSKQTNHVLSEYSVLSEIYHPFAVELKGVNFTDPQYIYFIQEYVPGGELSTLLKEKGSFPAKQAKFYAAHFVTIFDYLHSKNIIFRDLKPENILIQQSGYLKLTDFGFAKKVEDDRTDTVCGTPEYLAPEIIANKGHSKPADWWTLGILLYEMLNGVVPFTDPDPMMIYQKVVKCQVKYPKKMDKDGKALVKHFLVVDIHKRYGSSENGVKDIVDHKFFAGFDWSSLLFQTMTAPYKPKIRGPADTSRFQKYSDSAEQPNALKADKDPFLNW